MPTGSTGDGTIADLVVLYGDTPLISTETIAALLDARRRAPEAAVAVAGFRPADPGAYGRLVLDRDGGLARIVEAKDAGPDELAIRLCNGGIMAIDARHAFDLIDQIGNDNAKREFYLTDIVGIAKRRGSRLPRRRIARRGGARRQHQGGTGRRRGGDAGPAAPPRDARKARH